MSNKTKTVLDTLMPVIETSKVERWYGKNLQNMNQGDTLECLAKAVRANELTVLEAIALAFLVGFQWNVDFTAVNKKASAVLCASNLYEMEQPCQKS